MAVMKTIREWLNELPTNATSIETAVRILVYEIRLNNPESIKFIIDTYAIKSLTVYLATGKYSTIMYCYGYLFLLEILKIFEEHENYEECAEIKKAIEDHNIFAKDELPTK